MKVCSIMRDVWSSVSQNRSVQRWLNASVILVTLGFLLYLIIQERVELERFGDWRRFLGLFGKGLALYPLSLIAQAICWTLMISTLSHAPGGWQDVEIYAYTHLMRRLPGAVWYLAGRAIKYQARGIGANISLTASALEWMLLLIAAASIYGVLTLANIMPWPAAFVVMIFLAGLGAQLRKAGPGFRIGSRWLPKKIQDRIAYLQGAGLPSKHVLVKCGGLYSMAYLIGGVILYITVLGVEPNSLVTLADAVRIWSLAGGVSFLVSMAIPAGLGIRELALTALLSPFMPKTAALIVAILLRLLFTLGDMVWGGLMWLVAKNLQKSTKSLPKSRKF